MYQMCGPKHEYAVLMELHSESKGKVHVAEITESIPVSEIEVLSRFSSNSDNLKDHVNVSGKELLRCTMNLENMANYALCWSLRKGKKNFHYVDMIYGIWNELVKWLPDSVSLLPVYTSFLNLTEGEC